MKKSKKFRHGGPIKISEQPCFAIINVPDGCDIGAMKKALQRFKMSNSKCDKSTSRNLEANQF